MGEWCASISWNPTPSTVTLHHSLARECRVRFDRPTVVSLSASLNVEWFAVNPLQEISSISNRTVALGGTFFELPVPVWRERKVEAGVRVGAWEVWGWSTAWMVPYPPANAPAGLAVRVLRRHHEFRNLALIHQCQALLDNRELKLGTQLDERVAKPLA